ncbi:MAG: 4-(cytidine 5'-diphospho)-2-C-methyl-D-erythritol kinase [Gemmatimonadaceae bacterium]
MTGPAASIVAQAKLNLHLRVLAREPSGFHSLETIFHRIDLGDEISVWATSGERTIDVEGADVGPAESNLAFKAASAYSHRAGWPRGFRIDLNKRVPVGAGMGGGSADAAAVLRILDSLAPDSMGSHALMDLGASLGSDVPFLVGDAVMALAWGRGEKLSPLPPLPRRDVLLMTPDFSVPTADAYAWLDLDRTGAGNSTPASDYATSSLASRPPLMTWEGLAAWAWNDFEPVIVARHPELGEMLAKLRGSRPVFSGMTGSGSTIFGILDGPLDFARVPAPHRTRVRSTMSAIDVVQPLRIE